MVSVVGIFFKLAFCKYDNTDADFWLDFALLLAMSLVKTLN